MVELPDVYGLFIPVQKLQIAVTFLPNSAARGLKIK
jgi:hypothetical protein